MRRVYLIILFIVGAFIFLSNLGGRDLWEPDETRYAVVAREMRVSGNWILPHLNGRVYSEKPPLFFWIVNIFVLFLGEDSELTNRLPSSIAGLITIIITFLLGERIFNHHAGFFSALILSTCLLFPQISRWMMLDSIFTLLFLLTLFCFYSGYRNSEIQMKYYLFCGLFIGLGALTKGPVSYLTVLIFLIYSLLQGELRRFWNRSLLMGFLLSLLIILIWLVPACLIGGKEYTERILLYQTLGRLTGEGRHFHIQPIYFYIIRFPIGFLPWTFFIPFSKILKLVKDRKSEFMFLSVWFAVVFLFFTFSKGKNDTYILPLYPASSLIAACLWERGLCLPAENKRLILGHLILISLFFTALIIIISGYGIKIFPRIDQYQIFLFPILVYLIIGTLISLLFSLKRMKLISFLILVITFGFFHIHISYIITSKFNNQRSMKGFAEKVLRKVGQEDEIKFYYFRSTGLLYYMKKNMIEDIRDRNRLIEIMKSNKRVFVIVQSDDLDRIKEDLEYYTLERKKVAHWNLLLISNKMVGG